MPVKKTTGTGSLLLPGLSTLPSEDEVDYKDENIQGIAKIWSTNPELGRQMLNAYARREQHSGSLLSGMWNAVTSPAKLVFKGMQNVQTAVAEPFKNEEEGDEDMPWVDVWQGITGQEHTTWKENLVSWGAPEDHWGTSVAGLVGDIVADPLTYIGAGGLALPRSIVAKSTRELGETQALALLREGVKKEGGLRIGTKGQFKITSADDVVKLVQEHGREALTRAGVSDELLEATSGIAAGNADRTLLTTLDDVVQEEAKWVGTRLADAVVKRKSIRSLPEFIHSDVTGIRWSRNTLTDIFENRARLSPQEMVKIGDQFVGRRAAAALGGIRVKFGLPFGQRLANMFDKPWLGYRYTSGDLPWASRFRLYPESNTEVGFTKLGDFFRGTSGINRLDTAIQRSVASGDGVWQREDMQVFLKQGFTGLRQHAFATGREAEFYTLFGNKAVSSFFTAAERMGDVTSHFTLGAQTWRKTGIIGLQAYESNRTALALKKQYRRDASRFEGEWSKAARTMEQEIKKLPPEVRGNTAQKIHDDFIKYLEGSTDSVDALPLYLRDSARQMKVMFPKMLEKARQLGADVGDMTEVFARTRAETLISTAQTEIKRLDKEIAKLADDLNISAVDDVELGQRAAAAATPEVADKYNKIIEMQETIKRTTADLDDVQKQVDQMDEYESMIRSIRGGPRVADKLGPKAYFHRRLTPEAREALTSSLKAKYQHWGKAKAVRAQMERILATMDLQDAEKFLRKRHGIALKNVKSVWETNPFGVYSAYVEDMAEAVFKGQVGKNVEHLARSVSIADNGIISRITAHVPEDMYPRNVMAEGAKADGTFASKYKSLHDLLDEIHVAIGAKARDTYDDAGRAAWQGREPWREGRYGDIAEYLHVNDLDEFKEFDRVAAGQKIPRSDETVATLKQELKEQGYREPVILGYNPETGRILLEEGNHRLAAAKELVKEGHKEAAFIPVRVMRSSNADLSSSPFPTQLLDDAHKGGAAIPNEFGYVPADMKPSQLFNIESGRLGKTPQLTDEQAVRAQITLHELNRARAQSLGMVAEPEVAFKKIGLQHEGTMWGKVDLPGWDEFGFHPYIAAEFNRAIRGMGPLPTKSLQKNWRKFFLGPWKKAATIMFPGFHARNTMGAWFNNWLGGVTVDDYIENHRVLDVMRNGKKSEFYGKSWRKNVRIDGKLHKNVTYDKMATWMGELGIAGGNAFTVAELRNFLKSAHAGEVRAGHAISSKLGAITGRVNTRRWGQVAGAELLMREWERLGINATNNVENYFRGAAFLRGVQDGAGDTAGARTFVMMRHGDYDELTDMENSIRDLIPFYKWLRTNIPFQLRNLMENPGRQAAILDIQEAAVPEEQLKKLAPWMRESLQIPMPKALAKILVGPEGGGLLSVQLPLHDLYLSSNEFASSFLPGVKQLLIENQLFKKNLFTGAPIEGVPKYEAAGWINATGLGNVLNAVGIGEEGKDGKLFFSSRELNTINIFPIFARARGFMMEDPDRTKIRWSAALSAIAGIRTEGFGEQEFNEAERDWYFNVLEPQVRGLKNLGYKLPSIDDIAGTVNSIGERTGGI